MNVSTEERERMFRNSVGVLGILQDTTDEWLGSVELAIEDENRYIVYNFSEGTIDENHFSVAMYRKEYPFRLYYHRNYYGNQVPKTQTKQFKELEDYYYKTKTYEMKRNEKGKWETEVYKIFRDTKIVFKRY